MEGKRFLHSIRLQNILSFGPDTPELPVGATERPNRPQRLRQVKRDPSPVPSRCLHTPRLARNHPQGRWDSRMALERRWSTRNSNAWQRRSTIAQVGTNTTQISVCPLLRRAYELIRSARTKRSRIIVAKAPCMSAPRLLLSAMYDGQPVLTMCGLQSAEISAGSTRRGQGASDGLESRLRQSIHGLSEMTHGQSILSSTTRSC